MGQGARSMGQGGLPLSETSWLVGPRPDRTPQVPAGLVRCLSTPEHLLDQRLLLHTGVYYGYAAELREKISVAYRYGRVRFCHTTAGRGTEGYCRKNTGWIRLSRVVLRGGALGRGKARRRGIAASGIVHDVPNVPYAAQGQGRHRRGDWEARAVHGRDCRYLTHVPGTGIQGKRPSGRIVYNGPLHELRHVHPRAHSQGAHPTTLDQARRGDAVAAGRLEIVRKYNSK